MFNSFGRRDVKSKRKGVLLGKRSQLRAQPSRQTHPPSTVRTSASATRPVSTIGGSGVWPRIRSSTRPWQAGLGPGPGTSATSVWHSFDTCKKIQTKTLPTSVLKFCNRCTVQYRFSVMYGKIASFNIIATAGRCTLPRSTTFYTFPLSLLTSRVFKLIHRAVFQVRNYNSPTSFYLFFFAEATCKLFT